MENDIKKIEQQFNAIEDEQKRKDCFHLLKLMEQITGENPTLWRGNMIGFGKYQYEYESGRKGEWFLTGFCPRKQNLVVYIVAGFKNYEKILSNLGPYTTGSSCLYLKNLNNINLKELSKLITESVKSMKEKYNL